MNADHESAPISDPDPPAQPTATGRLAMLRAKLDRLQEELAELNQKKKGFLVNMEIEAAEHEMKKILLEIPTLEKALRGGV